MNIKNKVKDLVEKYNTNDPFELIEALDVVFYYADMHPNIQGVFYRAFGQNIICINDKLCDTLKREVAAHELGHLDMHTGINTYTCTKDTFVVKGKYEVQANAYATELLIPDDRYFKMLKEYPGKNLKDIAAYENISPELLEIKRFRIENKCF